jgi:cephalosporin hydroxylase
VHDGPQDPAAATTNHGSGEHSLPPSVSVDLGERVRDYWLRRAKQHTFDSYAGVGMSKFPEDLRVYEHLLWASHANVVIEIGTGWGGSAIWLRDRLRANSHYGRIAEARVISIDVTIELARERISAVDPGYADTITLVQGDLQDPGLPDRVAELVPTGSRCLVIEDSAHTYDTTRSALDGFARFVPPGGYFIVEDGSIDIEELRAWDEWPRGVLPAITDWLASSEGGNFTVRRDLERYGVTCHPHGFLQRIAPS